MKCDKCGNELGSSERTCNNCGQTIPSYSQKDNAPEDPVINKISKEELNDEDLNSPRSHWSRYVGFAKGTYADHLFVSLVLGAIGVWMLSAMSDVHHSIIVNTVSVVFMVIITPLGIFVGEKFRQFASPDAFLASGMMDIFFKKLMFSYGPQVVGGTVAMSLGLAVGFMLGGIVYGAGNSVVSHVASLFSRQTQTTDVASQPIQSDLKAPLPAETQTKDTGAAQTPPTLGNSPASTDKATPEAPPAVAPSPSAETTISPLPNPTVASKVEPTGICQGLDLAVTSDQLACLDKKFVVADKQLNDSYKRLMSTMDDARKAALKKEQVSWIKDKEAKCAKAGQENAGSQLEAVQISYCKVQMTEQRVSYLAGLLIAPPTQLSAPSNSSAAVATAVPMAPVAPTATPHVKASSPATPKPSRSSLVDWANK